MIRLVTIIVLIFLAPANAELNYTEFQSFDRQDPQMGSAALNGYLQGVHWANFLVREQTGTQLYCKPENLTINIENLRGGMKLYVEKEPELATAAVGKVVLAGLQLLFPCE
jgi:hypothetical protein